MVAPECLWTSPDARTRLVFKVGEGNCSGGRLRSAEQCGSAASNLGMARSRTIRKRHLGSDVPPRVVHPTAQFNLGGFFLNGKGLEKDVDQAIAWYTRAAEQRHELALIQLGSLYRWGDGVEADQNRALVLFLIAYGRGSTRAANHLALMFKKGLGVERNDSMAYELFVESLSRPDTPEVSDNLSYRGTAYYWLGYMAENSEGGLKRDLRAAKKWYRRGADCDQSNCIKALARLSSKASDKRCRNQQA